MSVSGSSSASYVSSTTTLLSSLTSNKETLIVTFSTNTQDIEDATFHIILTLGIQLGGPLNDTALGLGSPLALGPIAGSVGALASLASCYAAVYAESMAVVGTETALTSFLSSQWEQMSSIGIFNRVQSSLFAAVDTKIEAQAMFAQSAYTAISSMRQEQKKLLGLANLTSTNLLLQSSSEKVTLTTMAKATFILRQWKRKKA